MPQIAKAKYLNTSVPDLLVSKIRYYHNYYCVFSATFIVIYGGTEND